MDGVQSAMEFTHSLRHAMAKICGQVREANFDPGGDSFSKFRDQESHQRQSRHQRDQQEASDAQPGIDFGIRQKAQLGRQGIWR